MNMMAKHKLIPTKDMALQKKNNVKNKQKCIGKKLHKTLTWVYIYTAIFLYIQENILN